MWHQIGEALHALQEAERIAPEETCHVLAHPGFEDGFGSGGEIQ